MRLLIPALAICLIAVSARAYEKQPPVQDQVIAGTGLPKTLTEFGFFTDDAGRKPNDGVLPYALNSALFSDYAEKYRFWYVPEGMKALAEGEGLINFPVGSALIKSFGYERNGAVQLLETRVLLHREDGWVALPYVWNSEQTEAVLKIAGKRLPVSFVDPSGKQLQISYAVPNKNQCKECHAINGDVSLIGPKLRNLTPASIKRMIASNKVAGAFNGVAEMPSYADLAVPIRKRARAYLDVNCAHCHNDQGSASNSGLFLTYEERDPVRVGIGKRPVAAGRGSGGHEFAIAPGDPDKSIMIYRLKSLDPGIAMPEVGRSTVHDEGVALLSEWIAGMGD